MLRDPSPGIRATAKRSMTQESDAMDTKSQDQESKIIDLLSVDALTTRVQKVEEASSSNATPSGASTEGPPQPGEGAKGK